MIRRPICAAIVMMAFGSACFAGFSITSPTDDQAVQKGSEVTVTGTYDVGQTFMVLAWFEEDEEGTLETATLVNDGTWHTLLNAPDKFETTRIDANETNFFGTEIGSTFVTVELGNL